MWCPHYQPDPQWPHDFKYCLNSQFLSTCEGKECDGPWCECDRAFTEVACGQPRSEAYRGPQGQSVCAWDGTACRQTRCADLVTKSECSESPSCQWCDGCPLVTGSGVCQAESQTCEATGQAACSKTQCLALEHAEWCACADPPICVDSSQGCGQYVTDCDEAQCAALNNTEWCACADPPVCVDSSEGCGQYVSKCDAAECAALKNTEWCACADRPSCVTSAYGCASSYFLCTEAQCSTFPGAAWCACAATPTCVTASEGCRGLLPAWSGSECNRTQCDVYGDAAKWCFCGDPPTCTRAAATCGGGACKCDAATDAEACARLKSLGLPCDWWDDSTLSGCYSWPDSKVVCSELLTEVECAQEQSACAWCAASRCGDAGTCQAVGQRCDPSYHTCGKEQCDELDGAHWCRFDDCSDPGTCLGRTEQCTRAVLSASRAVCSNCSNPATRGCCEAQHCQWSTRNETCASVIPNQFCDNYNSCAECRGQDGCVWSQIDYDTYHKAYEQDVGNQRYGICHRAKTVAATGACSVPTWTCDVPGSWGAPAAAAAPCLPAEQFSGGNDTCRVYCPDGTVAVHLDEGGRAVSLVSSATAADGVVVRCVSASGQFTPSIGCFVDHRALVLASIVTCIVGAAACAANCAAAQCSVPPNTSRSERRDRRKPEAVEVELHGEAERKRERSGYVSLPDSEQAPGASDDGRSEHARRRSGVAAAAKSAGKGLWHAVVFCYAPSMDLLLAALIVLDSLHHSATSLAGVYHTVIGLPVVSTILVDNDLAIARFGLMSLLVSAVLLVAVALLTALNYATLYLVSLGAAASESRPSAAWCSSAWWSASASKFFGGLPHRAFKKACALLIGAHAKQLLVFAALPFIAVWGGPFGLESLDDEPCSELDTLGSTYLEWATAGDVESESDDGGPFYVVLMGAALLLFGGIITMLVVIAFSGLSATNAAEVCLPVVYGLKWCSQEQDKKKAKEKYNGLQWLMVAGCCCGMGGVLAVPYVAAAAIGAPGWGLLSKDVRRLSSEVWPQQYLAYIEARGKLVAGLLLGVPVVGLSLYLFAMGSIHSLWLCRFLWFTDEDPAANRMPRWSSPRLVAMRRASLLFLFPALSVLPLLVPLGWSWTQPAQVWEVRVEGWLVAALVAVLP